MPAVARKKFLDSFIIEFIYNSDKIEGSKLSFKDTRELFLHGITPKNKPINDVKEAEGYKEAIYDMINYKDKLTLKKILEWHNMIFKASQKDIAGKIRIHKIVVTGSRISFPHPEDLNKLLKDFFVWCKKNNKNYNPVEFAALVHLKFVTIHPFSDGNGRISRLLANYILHKNGYPMLNIKVEERKQYYHNLEKSQLWENEIYFLRYFIKKFIKENS